MSNAKLILDMSNNEYHAHSALSSSQIKDVLRSPAHFFDKHIKPGELKEPTANMLLGTLVHSLVLEPESFESEYAISQKFDRRTKKGKADAKAFEEANSDKTIIDQDMYDQAQAIANSIHTHPVAKLLMLPNMTNEASIFYTDPLTGLACRVRPDYHLPPCDAFPNGLIVDLKSTDNATNKAFQRTIVNFGYHVSAAMYQDGYMAYYKTVEAPAYIWLVVERDSPYASIAYTPSDESLEKGHDKKNEALKIISECRQSSYWPAYDQEVLEINLPAWA